MGCYGVHYLTLTDIFYLPDHVLEEMIHYLLEKCQVKTKIIAITIFTDVGLLDTFE